MDVTCIAAVAFVLTPAFRLGFVMTTEWALALMPQQHEVVHVVLNKPLSGRNGCSQFLNLEPTGTSPMVLS